MYVHKIVLLVMAALYVYLILTDLRLHKRVQKLEKIVGRLEGMTGPAAPRRKLEEEDLM